MVDIFQQFYKGKTVLVTGHTGFKGSWLSIWLHEMGAKVIGLSLDPSTEKDNFVLSGLADKVTDLRGDIRDSATVNAVFEKYQPEIVFHLAAQPIVRLSYEQPVETYQTNVMGSIHIMEAFRKCPSARVAVMITTDKCYENREQIWGYRENEPLGGYDPYSSSKGAAEIAISSWRRSFMNPEKYEQHHKSIASVRAGNVIGGASADICCSARKCGKSPPVSAKAGTSVPTPNPSPPYGMSPPSCSNPTAAAPCKMPPTPTPYTRPTC